VAEGASQPAADERQQAILDIHKMSIMLDTKTYSLPLIQSLLLEI